MNKGQRPSLGEKGSGSSSRPVMFKVTKICLMARSQSLRPRPSPLLQRQICPEHKTPRARAGAVLGRRSGYVGRTGIPPAGHSARTVLEAGPLHLVCHLHGQATAASPLVLDSPASDVGQHRPLVGSLGNALASGVVSSVYQGNGDSLQQ